MLPVPDPALCDGVVSLRSPEERDLLAVERGINDPDVISASVRPTLAAEQLLELNRNRWTQVMHARRAGNRKALPIQGFSLAGL